MKNNLAKEDPLPEKEIPKGKMERLNAFREEAKKLTTTRDKGHLIRILNIEMTIKPDVDSLREFCELTKEYGLTGGEHDYSLNNLMTSRKRLESGSNVEWEPVVFFRGDDGVKLKDWIEEKSESQETSFEIIEGGRGDLGETFTPKGDQPETGLEQTGTNGV